MLLEERFYILMMIIIKFLLKRGSQASIVMCNASYYIGIGAFYSYGASSIELLCPKIYR